MGMRNIHATRAPFHRPVCDTPLMIYLRARKLSFYSLAKAIGADPHSVGLWAQGRVIPSLIAAFKIEAATKGAVSAESWLGVDVVKKAWEAWGLSPRLLKMRNVRAYRRRHSTYNTIQGEED